MMPYGSWGGNYGCPNPTGWSGGQMGFPSAGPTWTGTYGQGQYMPGMYGQPYGMGPGNFGFGGQMPAGYGMNPWAAWNFNPIALGWGLGGGRRWGGTYSPQFAMTGLPTDEETTEMVYDAIDADPLIPFDADINVDTDAGTVTLTGTVPNKQIKHAVGDDAWWIVGVDDVRNELQVQPRRGGQEGQTRPSAGPTRMRR